MAGGGHRSLYLSCKAFRSSRLDEIRLERPADSHHALLDWRAVLNPFAWIRDALGIHQNGHKLRRKRDEEQERKEPESIDERVVEFQEQIRRARPALRARTPAALRDALLAHRPRAIDWLLRPRQSYHLWRALRHLTHS